MISSSSLGCSLISRSRSMGLNVLCSSVNTVVPTPSPLSTLPKSKGGLEHNKVRIHQSKHSNRSILHTLVWGKQHFSTSWLYNKYQVMHLPNIALQSPRPATDSWSPSITAEHTQAPEVAVNNRDTASFVILWTVGTASVPMSSSKSWAGMVIVGGSQLPNPPLQLLHTEYVSCVAFKTISFICGLTSTVTWL